MLRRGHSAGSALRRATLARRRSLALATALAALTVLAGLATNGSARQLNGSRLDDRLAGTRAGDVFYGDAGSDRLRGRAGDDVFLSDPSPIAYDPGRGIGTFPASGRDTVHGDGGDDVATTGDGDDLFKGGRGDDLGLLGAGDDTFRGGSGEDTAHGGPGADMLDGGRGDDALLGDADDVVSGGPGSDITSVGLGGRASGGPGDDLLTYCWGEDCVGEAPEQARLETGDGDDVVQVRPLGRVHVNTGGGDDRVALDFQDFPEGMKASQLGLTIEGGGGDDTLVLPESERGEEVPDDLEQEFEDVSYADPDEEATDSGALGAAAGSNGKAVAAQGQPAGAERSGLFYIDTALAPGSHGEKVWANSRPADIALLPVGASGSDGPKALRATLFLGNGRIVRATLDQHENRRSLYSGSGSVAGDVCGPGVDGPVGAIELDFITNALKLTCSSRSGAATLSGNFVASKPKIADTHLDAAQTIFRRDLQGTARDLTGKTITVDLKYPDNFPALSEKSSAFSAFKPIWTLDGIRELVATMGEDQAARVVKASDLPALPISDFSTPAANGMFKYTPVKRLGDRAFSSRNQLVDALKKEGLKAETAAAAARALSAVEVSRYGVTTPSLLAELEAGKKEIGESFAIRGVGLPTTTLKRCNDVPCAVETPFVSPRSILSTVATKLDLWTPERGGGPTQPFARIGSLPARNAGQSLTFKDVSLPPQVPWRRPIWSMAAWRTYFLAANTPNTACRQEFPSDPKTAGECEKALDGADPFWEFLQGLWVNVHSHDLVLGGGSREETVVARRGSQIDAGRAKVTSGDPKARYRFLELPMLQFTPFGANQRNDKGQYVETGWPYQSFCDRDGLCTPSQWRKATDDDVKRGYNSTVLKLGVRGENTSRAELTLAYPGQKLGDDPNPCDRAATGFEQEDRGKVTVVPKYMWYRTDRSGRRYVWESVGSPAAGVFRDVDFSPWNRPSFVNFWSKDHVERTERSAKTKKLELKTIRLDGERAFVCVTFGFSSAVVGRQQGTSDPYTNDRRKWKAFGGVEYDDARDRRYGGVSKGSERWGVFVGAWKGRLECPPEYPVNLSAWNRRFPDSKHTHVDDFEDAAGVAEGVVKAFRTAGEIKELLEGTKSLIGDVEHLAHSLGVLNTVGIGLGFAVEIGFATYKWIKGPPREKTQPYSIARRDRASVDQNTKNADDRKVSGWFNNDETQELETPRRGAFDNTQGDTVTDSARWGDARLGLGHKIGQRDKPGHQEVGLFSQNDSEISAWIQCTNRDTGQLADLIGEQKPKE